MLRFSPRHSGGVPLSVMVIGVYSYLAITSKLVSAQSASAQTSTRNALLTRVPAQESTANSARVFVLNASPALNCPVSLSAQQRSAGGVVSTGSGQSSAMAQRIRLILDKADHANQVASATVTVEGTGGKWRLLNASNSRSSTAHTQLQPESKSDSPYISSTLHIYFVAKGDQTASADLDLPGFTSVKSIRLDSVTYADGTTWTPDSGRACRVVPDPLMLISIR